MTAPIFTRETVLTNDRGERHTVSVKEMDSGFNYEVWLDEIAISNEMGPYGASDAADGLEEFFFSQGYQKEIQ